MADYSLIPEELKDRIGAELRPVVCEIEKGMLRRFAQAVGDPNPRWQSMAPPTLILTLGFGEIQRVLTANPSQAVLHGSTELECLKPVKPGDVITVTTRIANVRQRQSKLGETVFVTFDITCKNQRQEVVACCHQMAIIH